MLLHARATEEESSPMSCDTVMGGRIMWNGRWYGECEIERVVLYGLSFYFNAGEFVADTENRVLGGKCWIEKRQR